VSRGPPLPAISGHIDAPTVALHGRTLSFECVLSFLRPRTGKADNSRTIKQTKGRCEMA
jgi:hypothetical protein